MARSRKKGKQLTIENVLRSSPAIAQARGVVVESSDEDEQDTDSDDSDDSDDTDDTGDADDTDDTLGKRPQAKTRNKTERALVSDSDGEGEDKGGGEDDDDDDVRPVKRRRRERKPVVDSEDCSSDEGLEILTPPPKQTPSRLVRSTPAQRQREAEAAASGVPRSARKSSVRSVKQRHLELLRRRRLGEKVTESDLDEALSEDEQPRVALYDKDPDHVALSDFEDDEEEEEEEAELVSARQMEKDKKRQWKKDKKKEKKEKRRKAEKEKGQTQSPDAMQQLRSKFDEESDDGYGGLSGAEDGLGGAEDEEAEDMADFIDDSPAGLIGAPDSLTAEDEQAMLRREIPLQFTFQAHKPLKSHFKDAVEWLVHRRVNPGSAFAESDDELYRVAWDRLDREVGGLAQFRFISSVWTPEFYSTLRARPYMDSFNIRPSGGGSKYAIVIPGMDENVCHACGRTNHPASYRVMFSGKAYDSKTLDDIEEADSDEEDGEENSEDNDHESVDMNGNALPPTSRQWYVGATCHSNAETAHDLLHWRRALKDWVEEKLKADKLLDQLEGRKKKMKTHKRRAFANKIVDDWEANGTVTSLFRDFSKMLEGAQAKSTKTPSRFGR
ncbi:hypothetical protein SCUCBS95973_003204 [Sporothrix curviconia]|uniref:DUF4211 domain-containing protein n=1 Tax=Sporothrix curviconia TaxID=1260050 RepID=A0ABP0BD97_9PEZI